MVLEHELVGYRLQGEHCLGSWEPALCVNGFNMKRCIVFCLFDKRRLTERIATVDGERRGFNISCLLTIIKPYRSLSLGAAAASAEPFPNYPTAAAGAGVALSFSMITVDLPSSSRVQQQQQQQ